MTRHHPATALALALATTLLVAARGRVLQDAPPSSKDSNVTMTAAPTSATSAADVTHINHNHENFEYEINIGVPGLINGCLLPDYDSIRVFFGVEYAETQVKLGRLHRPDGVQLAEALRFEDWIWRSNLGGDGKYHVPYEITHNYPADQMDTIKSALANLGRDVGILRFRPKRATDAEWISITSSPGGGCASHIGRTIYAAQGQTILLQENDAAGSGCVYQGIVQHEMMHALGFFHEQARPDRDEYVTILFDNIQEGFASQFGKASSEYADSRGSPYDYGSVMHYGTHYFSKNGRPTIDARGHEIGNREGASPSDILQLRLLYQCRSGIRNQTAYLAQPCSSDCQCAEGMTGCAGDDDACHGDLRCIADSCAPDPFAGHPSSRSTSAKSCRALRFRDRGGSSDVCAATKWIKFRRNNRCLRGNWAKAKKTCERAKARLCTLDELRAREAADPTCRYNNKLVWTRTPCFLGSGAKGFVAAKGGNGAGGRCVALKSRKIKIRCCADA